MHIIGNLGEEGMKLKALNLFVKNIANQMGFFQFEIIINVLVRSF